MNTNDVSE